MVFFQKKQHKHKAFTEKDTIVYAIGDIHGCKHLLDKMHGAIAQHYHKHASGKRAIIVYLGDYIDRGEQSKEVLECLSSSRNASRGAVPGQHNPLHDHDFETIYLCGNHELAMLEFLDDPLQYPAWLHWGGLQTLASYGVNARPISRLQDTDTTLLREIHQEFMTKLPDSTIQFLRNMPLYYEHGDYLFVHAGMRPNIPLRKQTPKDLLTIRHPFIESSYDFDKYIIFGHTIFKKPFIGKQKIGIDTGAYHSGTLSAIALHDNQYSFLTAR